jgi:triosephosphate isomerase
MKHIFIAGNWKSNKTIGESAAWVAGFKEKSIALEGKWEALTTVVCVPSLSMQTVKEALTAAALPVAVASQNVSAYDEGAYTGEVTGKMVKEVADWVIIGHSERRKYFGETDEILKNKVEKAKAAGLKVIYCVPDDATVVPPGVDVVGYEPVWAIGTGKTDSPENANSVVSNIKSKTGAAIVIYGGSVTADNVATFVAQPAIDGVLPGGASLDPEKYIRLLAAAVSNP